MWRELQVQQEVLRCLRMQKGQVQLWHGLRVHERLLQRIKGSPSRFSVGRVQTHVPVFHFSAESSVRWSVASGARSVYSGDQPEAQTHRIRGSRVAQQESSGAEESL